MRHANNDNNNNNKNNNNDNKIKMNNRIKILWLKFRNSLS